MFTDLRIPAGRRPLTKTEAWITAVASIAFTVMVAVAVFEEFSVGRLSVVLFFLFWIPMLVLHELGHALMARALGWRVREIVIGFGRTLWQGEIAETRIEIKLAPVEGYVLPAPSKRESLRLKSALIYAAGPGVELLVLAIVIGVFGWDTVFGESDDIVHVVLQSLAVVVLLGAGFNLLPFRVGSAVSDGLGILSAPFMSESAVELRLLMLEIDDARKMLEAGETARALAALAALRERQPHNARLSRLYAVALAADGQDDAARDWVRGKLVETTMTDDERGAWLHLQARIELYARTPHYLTLDAALQKALGITPNAPLLLATKGASLVARQRYEEGGNALADAWRRNDGSASDAEMLAYLGIAARGVGDEEAWRRFAQAFAQINRSKWLEKRLRERLGDSRL